MQRLAVRLHQPHRKVDGGVVGHVEKENLGRADQQRGLDPRRLRRRAAIEQEAQQTAQAAEPAQHGGDQRAREGAVALVERGELSGSVEQFVERPAAAQHAIDDIGGDAAGGEAGHVLRANRMGLRLVRSLHSKNTSLRLGDRYAKSEAMPTDPTAPNPPAKDAGENQGTGKRPLTPAAERALAEAEARRAERERNPAGQPKEADGRGGLEPTRYGDWEKDGLASDF